MIDNLKLLKNYDADIYEAIIVAVGHDKYKQLSFNTENQVIFDLKSVLKDFNASL